MIWLPATMRFCGMPAPSDRHLWVPGNRPRTQHETQGQLRTEQATDAWRERYAHRSGVEGTIAQAPGAATSPHPLPRPGQDSPAARPDRAGSTSSAGRLAHGHPGWAAVGPPALPDSGPRPRLYEFPAEPVLDEGMPSHDHGVVATPTRMVSLSAMSGELVFTKVDGSASPAVPVTFADAGLREREHLQEWVLAHPQILGEDLRIVSFEFDRWLAGSGEPTWV